MEVQANTVVVPQTPFEKQTDPENSQASSSSSTRSSRSNNPRKSILKPSVSKEEITKTPKPNTRKSKGDTLKSENSSSTMSSLSSSVPSPSPSSNSNSETLAPTPSVSFADQPIIETIKEEIQPQVKQRTTRLSLSRNNSLNSSPIITNNTYVKKTPNGRNKKKLEPVIEIKNELKEEIISAPDMNLSIKENEVKITKKKSPQKKTPAKVKNAKFCPNDENTLDGFNNKEVKEDSNSMLSIEDTNSTSDTNTDKSNSKSSIKIAQLNKNFVEPLPPPTSSNTESSNNTQSNDGIETGDDNTQPGEQNDNEEQSLGSSETFKKKRRRRTSLMLMMTEPINNGQISASNLFIYKWPNPESNTNNVSQETNTNDNTEVADTYLLQEQFSEYLGIKSFKRKYPDLFRRLIDLKEREYLKENKVVTETQCDLGLTALKLSECLDIMADNYPDKYKDLNDVLYEKRRKNYMKNIDAHVNETEPQAAASMTATVTKTPRPGRVAMSEADRMKELIKKTIKSVSNYNLQLQKEKKEERSLYFDLQTMRVQKPSLQATRNIPIKTSNPNGQYPVAVLQGQYQNYYKKYTSDELKYLPVNTVIYAPPTPVPLLYEEWKQQQNQPTINNVNQQPIKIAENGTKHESSDEEAEKYETYNEPVIKKLPQSNKIANILANSSNLNNSNILANNSPSSFRITVSAAPTVANLINNKQTTPSIQPNILPKKNSAPIFKECYVCGKTSQTNAGTNVDQFMIGCSSCPHYSHPNCLEVNPNLVNWQCIMQYDWQCMECKRCTKCNNPHDEDKMMFCDRCDRGFHTYCVGLKEVPTGTWLCKSCDAPLNENYENINQMADSISPFKQQKVQILKPKLNSSLQFGETSMNSTPPAVRTGKRGRPPGSLNKPKDPNSPKKQPKSLIKKIKLENNMSNSLHRDEESMDGYGYDVDDELSNNLSLENLNNLINISISDRLVHSNY